MNNYIVKFNLNWFLKKNNNSTYLNNPAHSRNIESGSQQIKILNGTPFQD